MEKLYTLLNIFLTILSSLSVTSMVIVLIYFCYGAFSRLSSSQQRQNLSVRWDGGGGAILMYLLALTAILLYPLSMLNITPFEPYAWGYNAVFIPSAYLVLGLILVWVNLRYWPLFVLLCFIVSLYLLRFPKGDNFWNYLIDPIVGLYASYFVIKQGFIKLKGRAISLND
jgi:hypothetical protein